MGTYFFPSIEMAYLGLPIHIGSDAQEPGGAEPGTFQPLCTCGYRPLRSGGVSLRQTGES